MSILPTHPIEDLVFYLDDPITPETSKRIEEAVNTLAQSRSWVIAPPEFIDDIDESGGSHLIGTALGSYSSLSPNVIPVEIEMKLWEEAEVFLKMVEAVSREHQLDIHVALRQDTIGAVRNGEMDDSLSDTFLGEWRRSLEERSPKTFPKSAIE